MFYGKPIFPAAALLALASCGGGAHEATTAAQASRAHRRDR